MVDSQVRRPVLCCSSSTPLRLSTVPFSSFPFRLLEAAAWFDKDGPESVLPVSFMADMDFTTRENSPSCVPKKLSVLVVSLPHASPQSAIQDKVNEHTSSSSS